MASYLSIYRGSEGGAAKLALSQVSASNHPSVERALRLLTVAWTEVRIMSICPFRRESDPREAGTAGTCLSFCHLPWVTSAIHFRRSPSIC